MSDATDQVYRRKLASLLSKKLDLSYRKVMKWTIDIEIKQALIRLAIMCIHGAYIVHAGFSMNSPIPEAQVDFQLTEVHLRMYHAIHRLSTNCYRY